jgi:hypothetical protein
LQGDNDHMGMRKAEPLTPAEMEPLWRWEQQMTWLQISAMGVLLLGGVALHRYGDLAAWLRLPVVSGVIGLIGAAAVLQLRARCPRCRARVRSKLMTVLPDKCGRCGVAFPRRPETGG